MGGGVGGGGGGGGSEEWILDYEMYKGVECDDEEGELKVERESICVGAACIISAFVLGVYIACDPAVGMVLGECTER